MANRFLLAVDAGTGSVRAVLFSESGVQLSCSQQEWTHTEDPRYPGSMDFDWNKNWALASGCIRQAIEEAHISPSDIAAVSTTCMREGIVVYDTDGREIWACANVDARSGDEVAQLIRMDPELEKKIYHISGQTYALGAIPRILWIKNKLPDIYQKAGRISMFNDWLIYKMTGVLASEPSNGCTTGIFDLQKRAWEPGIMEKVGLRSDLFPPVRECGTVVGHVHARGEADTGLKAGTPVVAGGGDAQLGCVGVGVVNAGQAAVFGGSFWQYEFNTNQSSTDAGCRVRVNCHAVPGMWQYEAIAFMPGLAMRWYRDAFCEEEKRLAAEKGVDAYQLLNERAANVPAGSNGMMCAFSDVMNYIAWRHASPTFTGFQFDPAAFNKYTFYRAIMENAAMVTRGHINLVHEATGNAPEVIVFAGGASKGGLWCQILADMLGLPVKVPVVKEATALGAALLAGYGIGLWTDLSRKASEVVQWDKTYMPNPQNHALYSSMYEKWRAVYRRQLELVDSRVTVPMWSAPGL